MHTRTITAVHADEVETFLMSIGLLEPMKRGELMCGICGGLVTLENFQCAYPGIDEVKVCCTNPDCYATVLLLGSGEGWTSSERS